jgi:hypothetical protein
MTRPTCGTCHECGHELFAAHDAEPGGDAGPGEWCPECGVLWRYRDHGFVLATRQTSTFAKARRSSRCGLIERIECSRCLFKLETPPPALDSGSEPVTPTLLPAYQVGFNFSEEADL